MNGVVSFLRDKYAYILGFAVIEAGIYYFNGRPAISPPAFWACSRSGFSTPG